MSSQRYELLHDEQDYMTFNERTVLLRNKRWYYWATCNYVLRKYNLGANPVKYIKPRLYREKIIIVALLSDYKLK